MRVIPVLGMYLTRRLSLSRSDAGSGGNLSGRLKNHLTKTAVSRDDP